MGAIWRDALDVADARLAVWDEGRTEAVARLKGTDCLFTAQDVSAAGLDVLTAAARIPIN